MFTALCGLLVAWLLLFVVGAFSLNLELIKRPLGRWIGSASGLEIQLQGPLRLRLGPSVKLNLSDLLVYSTGSATPVIEVSTLTLSPQLLELLFDKISFHRFEMVGLRLNRCDSLFDQVSDKPKKGGAAPEVSVQKLTVVDAHISCTDSINNEAEKVIVEKLSAASIDGAPAWLKASVTWRDLQFDLDAKLASLSALLAGPNRYPVSLTAHSPSTSMEIEAELLNPLSNLELQANIKAHINDPTELLQRLEIDSIALPETTFETAMEWHNKLLTLKELGASSAGQPLIVNGQMKLDHSRPQAALELQAETLDFRALSPYLNATEQTSSTSAPAREDREIPLHLLRMGNAKLELEIGTLWSSYLPVHNLLLTAKLHSGRLNLDLNLESDAGTASTQLLIDSQPGCPVWKLIGQLENLNPGRLNIPGYSRLISASELDSGSFEIASCGNTTDELLQGLALEMRLNALKIHPAASTPSFVANTITLGSGWLAPTEARAELAIGDMAVEAALSSGSLHKLFGKQTVPVSLSVLTGENKATAAGELRLNDGVEHASLVMSAQAPDFGSLAPLTGLNPNYHKPLHTSVDINFDGQILELNNFQLKAGSSNVRGSLSTDLDTENSAPRLTLTSKLIDLVDLAQLIDLGDPGAVNESAAEQAIPDLPRLAFNVSLQEIRGVRNSIKNVTLHGAIENEVVDDATLSATVAAFDLQGHLDADFSTEHNTVDFRASATDIDLGKILATLELAEGVIAGSERIDLKFSSHGSKGKQMVDNALLNAELHNFEWHITDPLSKQDIVLTLPHTIANSRPEQRVTLETSGAYGNFPVHLWLELAPLYQLLEPTADFPMTLVADTDRETIILTGSFNQLNEDGVRGQWQLSGATQEVPSTELSSLKAPLPGFKLEADMNLGANTPATIKVNASIGSSTLNGLMELNTQPDRNYFDISINAPFLQANDFSPLLAVLMREEAGTVTPDATSQEENPSSFLQVLDDYLDRLPQHSDFNVDLQVSELMANEDALGGATAHAYVGEHNIQLDPVRVSLPGGDVDLSYTVNRSVTGVKTDFNARIESLELGGLLRLLNPEGKASGKLYLDTTLSAAATDMPSIPANIQGHFDLALFPQNLSASVLDLWASNIIVALMSQADEDSRQTNCLVARFDVEDGIMESNNILLDSTDIIVRGRGSINLSDQQLDLLIAPQAKREKFLSVSSPIRIAGPFDDFNVGLVRAGLVGTAFRWYMSLIYIPWKWLTGEHFPKNGIETCFNAMEWQLDKPGAAATMINTDTANQ